MILRSRNGVFSFFNRKQVAVEKLILGYTEMMDDCAGLLVRAFQHLFQDPGGNITKKDVDAIHAKESKADDIVREIESYLYGQALFPDSRQDILSLIYTADAVLNKIEECARTVYNQLITVPSEFGGQFQRLTDASVQCTALLAKCIRGLLRDYRGVLEFVGQIDQTESTSDHVQAELTRSVFSSDISHFEKILLRGLIYGIGSIADRAENASDKIRILVIKRTD